MRTLNIYICIFLNKSPFKWNSSYHVHVFLLTSTGRFFDEFKKICPHIKLLTIIEISLEWVQELCKIFHGRKLFAAFYCYKSPPTSIFYRYNVHNITKVVCARCAVVISMTDWGESVFRERTRDIALFSGERPIGRPNINDETRPILCTRHFSQNKPLARDESVDIFK